MNYKDNLDKRFYMYTLLSVVIGYNLFILTDNNF